jgi:hypothetical protein
MIDGMGHYADEVRNRRYPEEEHGYTMAPDEAERLREMLEHEAHAHEPFSGDW